MPQHLAGYSGGAFHQTRSHRAPRSSAPARIFLLPNLSISYSEPIKFVRGEGAWLIDNRGRAYLDCFNNVCHLGHAHPQVVEAIARQAAILNTNTRYLHDNIDMVTQK
ncbi:aminotransferase class III-fold pyridoxal phosphate-dependent enzyme [Klebsiella pneumoniae subsp. pneumoniae]